MKIVKCGLTVTLSLNLWQAVAATLLFQRLPPWWGSIWLLFQWERDGNGSSTARMRPDLDSPMMRLDDSPHDRQA